MAYSGSSANHVSYIGSSAINHATFPYQHSATSALNGPSAYTTGPYGGVGALAAPAANQKYSATPPRQRRRLNLLSVCLSLFGPWALFVVMFAVTSFSVQYNRPYFCYFVVGLGLAVVCFTLLFACDVTKKKKQGQSTLQPTWLIFVFITCMLMWCAGTLAGNFNFAENTRRFYDFQSLNTYLSVDPALMRGEQLMDGGRVQFVDTSRLDLGKAMGFRNGETYCVAPITSADPGDNTSLSTYDFWAVGKNCCLGPEETEAKGQSNGYHCGVASSPKAHG
jgi:hypothetical protein